jgi:hypothetical protein
MLTERPPLVGEVSANFLRIQSCRVVSAKEPFGCNLGFLDRSGYFFFQVGIKKADESKRHVLLKYVINCEEHFLFFIFRSGLYIHHPNCKWIIESILL